jgi:hypothetical protein
VINEVKIYKLTQFSIFLCNKRMAEKAHDKSLRSRLLCRFVGIMLINLGAVCFVFCPQIFFSKVGQGQVHSQIFKF